MTGSNPQIIEAKYVGPVCCPVCNGTDLRTKDRIQRHRRSTERFRLPVHLDHRNGISQEQPRRNCRIGTATVECWFHDHLDPLDRPLAQMAFKIELVDHAEHDLHEHLTGAQSAELGAFIGGKRFERSNARVFMLHRVVGGLKMDLLLFKPAVSASLRLVVANKDKFSRRVLSTKARRSCHIERVCGGAY
ncbi:hypothetical protein [Pontiella sulfatireligans]|uniref:hypothetical protein n=1 Tax=Pontiella sulfatireligans TaxID=2750658 RepID=UPI00109D1B47|nr:hypothetical protein [Pontiella sulfatireligans]